MKRKARRKMLGIREPNGRLSRRKDHVEFRTKAEVFENQRVVLEARVRHTGLPAYLVALNEAGRPNAGTLHGRMCLSGDLTLDQFATAEWWIGKNAAWLRAIDAPEQHTGPGPTARGEPDPEKEARFAEAVREEWHAVCDCVQTASTENRAPLMSALDVFLVRGHHLQHMVGDLRIALNAVHRRFLAGQRRTG